MLEETSQSLEELLHSAYRYALSLTHDITHAEDIVQDAWLAVLKAKGPHSRPYLFSAVRTRFFNLHKREQLVAIVLEDHIQALDDEQASSPMMVEDYLENTLLEKAMGNLRGVEREALFLMAVEGYTAKEIAALTEQPRGTVLSHIHRAKQKVRDFLTKHDIEVRHER